MGRERRRVVALSAADRERVARGELPEAQAEVERRRGVDALTQARARQDGAGERANDARLLAEVPPHWG
ncbi:transcriptional regulator [Actinomyces sp. 186855]|nr:transcriptional regulator [Actinomyces sp. 187325]MCL3792436.1 transcriptional regulator [Actinomyces sp. 186855]MCL3794698.1 transcriptional regulator [Actinomyces sp. 217892]